MVVPIFFSVLLALATQENASLHLDVRRAADEQILPANSLVYQGEVLYLDLEITFTEEFHNRQLINPWRMPLDVPVELQLPWVEGNSQWQVVSTTSLGEHSLVINRDKSLAQRLDNSDDGRIRYLLHREIRLTTDQVFEIPAATMDVVWATKFEDDLARGLVPLDRQEAIISSEAIALKAAPLPLQGQPTSFRGAVGSFDMKLESELRLNNKVDGAAAQQTNQAVASSEELIWDIMIYTGGRGWLEKSMLATLEHLDGFHVLGQKSDVTDDGMVVIAELSTKDAALLPTLPPWSYFNPSPPARYVTIGATTSGGSGVIGVDENTMNATDSSDAAVDAAPVEESSNLQLYWIGAGGVLFVFGILHLLRRRPQGELQVTSFSAQAGSGKAPAKPGVKPVVSKGVQRESTAVVAPSTSPPRAHQPADFIQKLADHLGCKREEVYADNFAQRLASAGIPEPLCSRIQTAVNSIVAARFGGSDELPQEQELEAIMCELTT